MTCVRVTYIPPPVTLRRRQVARQRKGRSKTILICSRHLHGSSLMDHSTSIPVTCQYVVLTCLADDARSFNRTHYTAILPELLTLDLCRQWGCSLYPDTSIVVGSLHVLGSVCARHEEEHHMLNLCVWSDDTWLSSY